MFSSREGDENSSSSSADILAIIKWTPAGQAQWDFYRIQKKMPWWIQGGDHRAWPTGSMFQGLNVEGRRRLVVWQIQWLDSMLFQGQIFREDSSSVSIRENVSHYFRSDRIHHKAFNPFYAGSLLIIPHWGPTNRLQSTLTLLGGRSKPGWARSGEVRTVATLLSWKNSPNEFFKWHPEKEMGWGGPTL